MATIQAGLDGTTTLCDVISIKWKKQKELLRF